MQKSGFIPTIIALLFLCLFSNFSSFCLTETGRLLRGSKNLYSKTLDYCHIIDYLIKDSIFAMSSKFCVIINHLLYSILCIITLYKAVNIFIFTKLDIMNFLVKIFGLPTDLISSNHGISNNINLENQNFVYRVGNEILNSEEMVVLLFLFILFLGLFLINNYDIVRKIYNFLILTSCIILFSFISFYLLSIYNNENKNKNHNKIGLLFGSDYTYVKYK
jgi:hypothetical protein